MAVFKIIGYHPDAAQGGAEIRVHVRSGELAPGDTFRCYDTHHLVDYRIRTLLGELPVLTLQCLGYPCYSGAFVGAVIDTEKAGKPGGFHYEHNSEP